MNCGEWKRLHSDGLCNDCTSLTNLEGEFLYCENCEGRVKRKCKVCKKDSDIIFSTNVCADCRFGDDWEEDPANSLRTSTCSSCSRDTFLNEDRRCLKCYKEIQIIKHDFSDALHTCESCNNVTYLNRNKCTRCEKNRKECIECGAVFTPTSSSQLHCELHLPVCLGCTKSFVPYARGQKRCRACEVDYLNGICCRCGKDYLPLDANGLCEECEPVGASPNMLCIICEESEVRHSGMICEDCIEKGNECAICHTKISASSYLCDSCMYNKQR